MNYKIYIQSLNNFPVADWALSAYLGFKMKGADIILFEDIEEVPKSKWNVVVADIESTNKYFDRWGISPKQALNIPEELNQQKYLGRWTSKTLMHYFKSNWTNFPVFIKPDGKAKEFVAGVVTDKKYVPFFFKDVPDDSPILLSEKVNFISEYRGYVLENKLIGLYWYFGDFKIFPNVSIIEEAIQEYTSQPIGYSIDFGITDEGKTLLIECNDGWSLGNYGLEDGKYANLLAKRWLQIFKSY